MKQLRSVYALIALGGLLAGAGAFDAAALATPLPAADTIFARAKAVWRGRVEQPFVRYSLLERYTWRNRVHDNWWRAAYRERDRRLSLQRIIVPEQEQARLRGTSIALNLHIHHGSTKTTSLETNPDADAFPILDPVVDPNASFGLARSDAKAALAGSPNYSATPGAQSSPAPEPSQPPAIAPSPDPFSSAAPLRELARVEAVARDYTIALAGIDRVRDEDAYHLTLVPVRDPRTYRLRDLWVATKDYETLKLNVDGLFSGRPYDEVKWTVTFVDFSGLAYVQQIRTEDTLRFGIDRFVDGLEYDFVDYSFPPDMSPMDFDRLL